MLSVETNRNDLDNDEETSNANHNEACCVNLREHEWNNQTAVKQCLIKQNQRRNTILLGLRLNFLLGILIIKPELSGSVA